MSLAEPTVPLELKVGQLVWIYSDAVLRPARVVGLHTGKVEVEHAGGQRVSYAERRVARVSRQAVPTPAALQAYVPQVEAAKGQVDLETLWHLVTEVAPDREHTLSELAALALGDAGPLSEDAVAWCLALDATYFHPGANGGHLPSSATSVDERKRREETRLLTERELGEAVDWLDRRGPPSTPGAIKVLEALAELVVFNDEERPSRFARQALRKWRPHDTEADLWMAWRIVVDTGVFDVDENLALRRNHLRRDFPASVLEASAALCAMPPETAQVLDLRALHAVAVDDPFTSEVDDALAITVAEDGTRTVTVFIADVAAWVPPSHPVDAEARRRCTTVYVPEGKLPMLPPDLGQHAASLEPGQDRLALAFRTTLDAEANVLDFAIVPAQVNVRERLTYDDVNRILAGEAHPMSTGLGVLLDLSDRLRAGRRRDGALILDRRELSLHVLPDKTIDLRPYRTDDPARRLVSEWMVMSCVKTAEWCRSRKVPAVYRAQDPPENLGKVPQDRPLEPHELNQVLRSLRKADLRAEPAPHCGLGVSCYTQVTSPLRRYQDLLMHRQVKAVLATGKPVYSSQELMQAFAAIEETVAKYGAVERESRRYWLLRWLEPKKGQKLPCIVLRESGRGRWIVEVLDVGLQAMWTADRAVEAGTRLELTLKGIDARKDKLVLV